MNGKSQNVTFYTLKRSEKYLKKHVGKVYIKKWMIMSVTTVSNHFSTTYAYDLNFLKIIVEFKSNVK